MRNDVLMLGNTAFLPGIGAAVSLAGNKPHVVPSSPALKQTGEHFSGGISKWGEDNLFPQRVFAECSKNTIIGSTLDWKARALYSGGLQAGKIVDFDDDGNEIFKPVVNKDFEDFRRKSALHLYSIETAGDFYWYYNAFPELILSSDRKKITSISAQEAMFSRWGTQNEKTGLVDTLYVNANWHDGENENSKSTIKIPALDPYYDAVGALRARDDSYKYIYPLSYPSRGKTIYQLADWDSLRTSGWLTFLNNIPVYKTHYMVNELSVKFHIEIAEWYWKAKFKLWDTFTDDEKIAKQKAALQDFNDLMTKPENAGKALITMFRSNPEKGTEQAGWKITAINTKGGDGKYIEDSQEGSLHLLYALGVDGTLVATTPGKGMGGGSGSDKREAFNMYLSMCQIHADIILSPLYLIRDYNNWDPELEFRYKKPYLQTLNKVTPSKRDTKLPQ